MAFPGQPGFDDGFNGQPGEAEIPPGFKGDAERLTRRGMEAEARLYKMAAAFNDPNDKQLWDELRWAPGLDRPVYTVQFGVALEITGPGAQQDNQPGGNPGGAIPLAIPIPGANPAFNGGGADANQQQQAQLQQLQQAAGPIAGPLLESLKLRTNAGLFGGKPNNQANAGGQFGGGQFGGGQFGGGSISELGRGVTMIGVGDRKMMLDAAEAAQVDVLIFFDIDTALNRKLNQVTATMRVRLYDVQSGRQMFQTKSLSSSQVAMAQNRAGGNFGNNNNNNNINNENDPIMQFAKSVIDYLDKNLMLQNVPASFVADDLRKRIETLTGKPPKNKLPHLVEFKLYERKGALPAAEVQQAIEKLLGPIEAKILLAGKEKERDDLLGRMLPPLPLEMRPKGAVVAGGPAGGPPVLEGPIEGRRLLGIKLPNTPFTTLDGKSLNLAQGGNVMLVHFWSSSQPNVKKNLETLSQIQASYGGQGLVVVGICLDTDRAAVDKLLKEKSVAWPQLFDGQGPGNPVSQKLAMRSPGLNLLVDKTGTVRYVNVPDEELSQKVAELMK